MANLPSPPACGVARLIELGVRKDDPVALLLGNCPKIAITHGGIQKLGSTTTSSSSAARRVSCRRSTTACTIWACVMRASRLKPSARRR